MKYTENNFEVEFFDENDETIGVYTISREYLGMLPIDDIKGSICALSDQEQLMSKLMNFNFKDVENHLRIELDRHGKQIKINQIVDATNNLLVDFIDLLEKEKFEKMYVDYIYNFLEKLDHRKYDYREALDMFEDFNNQLRAINQKLLNPQNKIDGNDFKEVRNIMNKHRR